ncbi:NUDIX hydrolase [Neptunitalea lumnitzerae]|uniref:DNA mismatch repair protein MutT n=1 Tax=Neptunitalea lumnitzerae TaxID=2965509 RepID=A0ABQ5MIY3_9FLAO|nr:NUDIX domain-containing protein [Neptunitalea sp. Y10]GLB49369.1 DNA mismatch repair protein MutT [Neptunitalea sp. Y10]
MDSSFYKFVLASSEEHKKRCLPSISIDCVIFGFHKNQLKILLLNAYDSNEWGLPGGYVGKEEDIDYSANRILEERTGAKNIYLSQFKTFGKTNRSESFFDKFPDDLWHKQRFISIGYYALIDYENVSPVKDEFSELCEWKNIDDTPTLMMDHQVIFNKALEQLRVDLNYKPVGHNLLPEKFTMPELQKLYEVILGKKLNRGNFYRKMKRFGILNKLDETRKGGAHKAPDLYSFNQENYNNALNYGFQEIW